MNSSNPRKRWTKFILMLIGGGVAGALLSMIGFSLIAHDMNRLDDYIPVILSILYALLGVTVWFNPYVRKTARPDEQLWMRCVVMLISAIVLVAPILAPANLDPRIAFLIIVSLYLGSVLVNRMILKRVDELTRRVIADTHQMAAQWIVTLLFFLGAAERLGLVEIKVSLWVINGIVWWLYFVVTQIAWMRRGVGNPLVAQE